MFEKNTVEVLRSYIVLVVNEYGDTVEFSLNASRGDGQQVHFAYAYAKTKHLHRIRANHSKLIPMKTTLIGSTNPRFARLACECGFTLVIPETGLSARELRDYFKRWNPLNV